MGIRLFQSSKLLRSGIDTRLGSACVTATMLDVVVLTIRFTLWIKLLLTFIISVVTNRNTVLNNFLALVLGLRTRSNS